LEAWKVGSAFAFTIEKKEDRTFVGRIAIRLMSTLDLSNIGYWTHPEHQKKGFMTEAAQAVVEFGFSVLGAKGIEARHATWNIPSRVLLERIGMVEVEYLPQGFQKQGAWVPEYRMLIERKENMPKNNPLPTYFEHGLKNKIRGSNPGTEFLGYGTRIDSFSRIGNHSCDVGPPMITPILLRARSLDEPGAGIPHAGISEGLSGNRRFYLNAKIAIQETYAIALVRGGRLEPAKIEVIEHDAGLIHKIDAVDEPTS
jgi:hypothetical protein